MCMTSTAVGSSSSESGGPGRPYGSFALMPNGRKSFDQTGHATLTKFTLVDPVVVEAVEDEDEFLPNPLPRLGQFLLK